MQTTYTYPSALTYEGEIVSSNKKVKSAPAMENIDFGHVVGYVGTVKNGYQMPSANELVFAGDLITDNVINMNVTVKTISNGVEVSTTTAIAPVTFAVSHGNTMDLLCAAIQAIDSKLTADDLSSDSNNRTIAVTHSEYGVVIISDVVVTLGVSQTTASYAFYGTMEGLAEKSEVERDADGSVYYHPNMMVNAMTQGEMTVQFIDATNLGSTLYAQFITATGEPRGSIRTSTDSGVAQAFSGLKCSLGAGALALGNVELNLP